MTALTTFTGKGSPVDKGGQLVHEQPRDDKSRETEVASIKHHHLSINLVVALLRELAVRGGWHKGVLPSLGWGSEQGSGSPMARAGSAPTDTVPSARSHSEVAAVLLRALACLVRATKTSGKHHAMPGFGAGRIPAGKELDGPAKTAAEATLGSLLAPLFSATAAADKTVVRVKTEPSVTHQARSAGGVHRFPLGGALAGAAGTSIRTMLHAQTVAAIAEPHHGTVRELPASIVVRGAASKLRNLHVPVRRGELAFLTRLTPAASSTADGIRVSGHIGARPGQVRTHSSEGAGIAKLSAPQTPPPSPPPAKALRPMKDCSLKPESGPRITGSSPEKKHSEDKTDPPVGSSTRNRLPAEKSKGVPGGRQQPEPLPVLLGHAGKRATAGSTSADAKATSKTTETPASRAIELPLPTEGLHRPAATREISLRIPGSNNSTVDLHLIDRGGRLHIAVRTAEAELTTSLRRNLGDLVARMERQGFRAEIWTPAGMGLRGTTPNGVPTPDATSFLSGYSPGGGQSSGDAEQHRGEPEDDSDQWFEEMERDLEEGHVRSLEEIQWLQVLRT